MYGEGLLKHVTSIYNAQQMMCEHKESTFLPEPRCRMQTKKQNRGERSGDWATQSYSMHLCNHLDLLVGASQLLPVVKNLPANAGDIRDADSMPGSGRSSGGRPGNPLRYVCLEKAHVQRSLVG